MKQIAIGFVLIAFGLPLLAQNPDITMPKFAQTTKESVFFRYKHTAGEKFSFDAAINMDMHVQSGKQKSGFSVLMNFSGYYVVKEVLADAGARIEYYFTRFYVKSQEPREIVYDSDQADKAPPEFAKFKYYLNTPVVYTIDPRGKILETDSNPIIQAMEDAGETASGEEIASQLSEFSKSSFIQLAAKPIKAGDVYEAGDIVNEIPGLGKMTIHGKYRLAAVAADKKTALLEPVISFEFKGFNMSKSRMQGWVLFDLEKGNIIRSYGDLRLEFSITEGKQKALFQSENTVLYFNKF